jgi:hypothetical protein
MSINGFESLAKSQQLKEVLRVLGCALPGLEMRDHWDADLCAVGVAPVSAPSLLIYVSCYGNRPDHVDYSIEDGGAEVETGADVPISTISGLISAIQSRLGRNI